MAAAELTITTTQIPGLLLVQLPVHGDARGWFKENWQREKMVAAGLPDFGPVQNNISFNAAVGTTRGIHAEPWDKYVSVATGKIFGAWVDLRAGENFGTVFTTEITPGQAVFVPRGVGNSFQTLEENTAYTYLVNDHWSADAPQLYTFLNLADPTVAIDWPIPLDQVVLSEKDRNHPYLDAVTPMDPAPVIILGANGQLGRALIAQCDSQQIPYQAYDRSTWDLAEPSGWPLKSLRGARAVINAAAHTQVDAAQTPEGRTLAWAVNATGVSALAAACQHAGVPLAHVSTDYVFDGTLPLGQEYPVEAAVAPVSVYGQSKAAGESAVRALGRHWIVRTSWVIGEGNNFVTTMARLAATGVDPTVVDDQHGRLTFARDLASALLQMVLGDAPSGTYHYTSDGPVVSWYEIARWVYEDTGHDPDRVSPISTADYTQDKPGQAPRPTNSTLDLTSTRDAGLTLSDMRSRLTAWLDSSSRTSR